MAEEVAGRFRSADPEGCREGIEQVGVGTGIRADSARREPPHEPGAKVVMTLADGTRVEFPAGDRELIAHVVLSVATAHAAAALQGGDR